MQFILLLVSIGVVVSSYGEIHYNIVGTVYQVSGIFVEALRLVLTQVLLQKKGLSLNPITNLYYIARCSSKGEIYGDVIVGEKRTDELISFFPPVASGNKVEDHSTADIKSNDPAPSMSRRDLVGELLVNLPRIASLPQFLYNMYDDFDYKSR
ncbi:hypothetical protein FXO38_16850 [Capsicum annuum]|nr:hypothetical protein FXO38_16850 [Capsicum annuum]